MRNENVEIVREVYAAWAEGRFPGPPELLDEQIEYVNPEGALEPGVQRGLAAFARAVGRVLEAWETWDMQPGKMTASGDRVAVEVHYRARGRGSGAEVEGRESSLWTVKGGAVTRYEWFHGPEDAFLVL